MSSALCLFQVTLPVRPPYKALQFTKGAVCKDCNRRRDCNQQEQKATDCSSPEHASMFSKVLEEPLQLKQELK